MSTTTYTKQPSEVKQYAIDFTNLLADGDSLASVTSVTGTPTGLTITDATLVGTSAAFLVAGGTNLVTYTIEAVVQTTGGETLEGDGYLAVVDLPTSPIVTTGYTRHILTFQDCYERAVNFLRANGHDTPTRTTGPPELIRGAVIDAYEHVLNACDWPALEGVARIHLHGEQTAGTVSYTHGNRVLTIADGTFPSWCEGAAIRFNGQTHEIQTYVDSSTVLLDETLNPGEDVADCTYRLFRWWYELPRDLGSIRGMARETRGAPVTTSFAQIHGRYRTDFASGYVQQVAIGAHPSKPGRQVLAVYPASSADEAIDLSYHRRPRDLRFAGYDATDDAGTVSTTETSTVVSGVGTAFSVEMEGALMRISRNTTRPTGTHGSNRYAEQHPILSVSSTTALVMAHAADATRSAVAYVVTDPLLIDPPAYNAVLRRIDFELATMFRSELLGAYQANAEEALRLGMQGAVTMPPTLPGIPWRLGDGRTIVETG